MKSSLALATLLSATLVTGCYNKLGEGVGRSLAEAFGKIRLFGPSPPVIKNTQYLLSEDMRVVKAANENTSLRPSLGRESGETGRDCFVLCYFDASKEQMSDVETFVRLAKQYSESTFVCEDQGYPRNAKTPAYVEIISAPPVRRRSEEKLPEYVSHTISVQGLEQRLLKKGN